jgi:hypothetical protein
MVASQPTAVTSPSNRVASPSTHGRVTPSTRLCHPQRGCVPLPSQRGRALRVAPRTRDACRAAPRREGSAPRRHLKERSASHAHGGKAGHRRAPSHAALHPPAPDPRLQPSPLAAAYPAAARHLFRGGADRAHNADIAPVAYANKLIDNIIAFSSKKLNKNMRYPFFASTQAGSSSKGQEPIILLKEGPAAFP